MMAGCASVEPEGCAERVQKLAEKQIDLGAPGMVKAGLPRADEILSDGSNEKLVWLPLKISGRMSLSSPPVTWYAVMKKGEYPVGDKMVCDLKSTYIVVAKGGIGNPKQAFGPLGGD